MQTGRFERVECVEKRRRSVFGVDELREVNRVDELRRLGRHAERRIQLWLFAHGRVNGVTVTLSVDGREGADYD